MGTANRKMIFRTNKTTLMKHEHQSAINFLLINPTVEFIILLKGIEFEKSVQPEGVFSDIIAQ